MGTRCESEFSRRSEQILQKETKQMIRKKLGCGKPQKSAKRTPWNEQEIEALIEGYEKYQQHENAPIGKPGIWAYTLKDPKLNKILCKNGREGRNLKDKWRHLIASNDERIQHLLSHKQRTEAN